MKTAVRWSVSILGQTWIYYLANSPTKIEVLHKRLNYRMSLFPRDNRDQLWAEASQREANAETIWLDDIATNTLAIQAQAARLAEDPWHDKVRDYIQGLKMTTVPDLFDHILYVPTERQTKSLEMRVAAILKSLGWDKETQWNGVTKKVAVPLKVVRTAKMVSRW
jgi:predicted P-loop ATPase